MTTLDEPRSRHDHVRIRRARGNRRRTWVIVAAFMAILVVPLLLVGGWFYLQLHPWGGPGDEVVVTVEDGWDARQIGAELDRQGVIGSSLVFRLWERDVVFIPGTYRLAKNLGVVDASKALRRDIVAVPEIGVLPGQTITEISERVGGIQRFSPEHFIELTTNGGLRSKFEPEGVNTLEGLLAPKSYRVPSEMTEEILTSTMVATFDERASALGLEDSAAALGRTPYEVIIVASLVQREARLDAERPLIAAVIYNRLAAGTPLQIDATSQYAAATGNAAYDTYAIAALPPTPISTVSSDSLAAAMHPASVTYQFYVLGDQDGGHAFADTYAEHLANVAAAEAKGLL